MVITSSRAVIEVPTPINWDLLELMTSQEIPKENTSSAVQDQPAIPSQRATKPSIESACERVGYRIGRLLGDAVQAQQQFRSVHTVSFPNPVATATATSVDQQAVVNTPAVLPRQVLTSGHALVSPVDYPRRCQVSTIIARVLHRIKMLAAGFILDFRAATKDVLKGRVAKFALACIIGSVAAEFVLSGFGVFTPMAYGGIPRPADIAEQAIDLSGSIGEVVLGFMLSPYVAEIAITGLVILSLVFCRRWAIKHSKVAAEQTR
jgi:hypothetical protein